MMSLVSWIQRDESEVRLDGISRRAGGAIYVGGSGIHVQGWCGAGWRKAPRLCSELLSRAQHATHHPQFHPCMHPMQDGGGPRRNIHYGKVLYHQCQDRPPVRIRSQIEFRYIDIQVRCVGKTHHNAEQFYNEMVKEKPKRILQAWHTELMLMRRGQKPCISRSVTKRQKPSGTEDVALQDFHRSWILGKRALSV